MWSSISSSSKFHVILLRVNVSITVMECDMRLIVLIFWKRQKLPIFGSGVAILPMTLFTIRTRV